MAPNADKCGYCSENYDCTSNVEAQNPECPKRLRIFQYMKQFRVNYQYYFLTHFSFTYKNNY